MFSKENVERTIDIGRKNMPIKSAEEEDMQEFSYIKQMTMYYLKLPYLRTLDSSVSKSIRKRIPTETRVWNTALTYFVRGMTNSDGLALELFYTKKLFQDGPN